MPVRESEPELRTWWRWSETGALVYWLTEDVYLSYLAASEVLHEQTAIVRRHSEDVLVLVGDHRDRLQHLTVAELARYYDASPQKAPDAPESWGEGLSN